MLRAAGCGRLCGPRPDADWLATFIGKIRAVDQHT
jgi:hypothetical protein